MQIEDRIQQAYRRTIPLGPPPQPNGLVKHPPTPLPIRKPQRISTKGLPLDYKIWIRLSHFLWNVTWKDVANWLKKQTIAKYPRIRAWFATITSKRVSEEVHTERDNVCIQCPMYEAKSRTKAICNGATIRNHKSKWYCPAKKHENNYPVYHQITWGHIQLPKEGGCSGCQRKGKKQENPQ